MSRSEPGFQGIATLEPLQDPRANCKLGQCWIDAQARLRAASRDQVRLWPAPCPPNQPGHPPPGRPARHDAHGVTYHQSYRVPPGAIQRRRGRAPQEARIRAPPSTKGVLVARTGAGPNGPAGSVPPRATPLSRDAAARPEPTSSAKRNLLLLGPPRRCWPTGQSGRDKNMFDAIDGRHLPGMALTPFLGLDHRQRSGSGRRRGPG